MLRAVTVAMFGIARLAEASPARLELRGDACDLSSLASSITTVLGGNALDPTAPVVMTVESVPTDSGARAQVWFDDGVRRGPRVVVAVNCNELVEAITVIAAMALPELVPPEPRHAQPPTSLRTSHPELGIVATTSPPALPRRTRVEALAAAAGGVTRHGFQQQLIMGARRRDQRRSVGIEARFSLPDEVAAAGGGVDVWTLAASLSGCIHIGSVAGCALGSAGVIRGSGERLEVTSAAFSPLAALGARLTWEYGVSRSLSLRLHVDAEVNLTKTRFDVDHMPVWVSDRFSLWTGAGVIAHFP